MDNSDCTIHAREWIAAASCRYFIHEVLNAAANPEYEVKVSLPYNASDLRGLLDFNWYIILDANPDGYDYSHTTDRMWRKNRRKIDNSKCDGVILMIINK